MSRKALASAVTVVEAEPEQCDETRGTPDDDDDDGGGDSDLEAACWAFVLGMESPRCTRVARGGREDCSEACKAARKRGLRTLRDADRRHREVINLNVADAKLDEQLRFDEVDDLIRGNRGLVGSTCDDRVVEDASGNATPRRRRITDEPISHPYQLEQRLTRGLIDRQPRPLDLKLARRAEYVEQCVETQRRLRRDFYERRADGAHVHYLRPADGQHQLTLELGVAA